MSRRRIVVALLLALPLVGCVTVRPWRQCPQPCPDARVARSQQARIVGYDGRVVVLDHPQPGMDDGGKFIAGQAQVPNGPALGPLRIHARDICVIETRKVEPGRVAANAVLVPLGVAAAFAAAYEGVDVDVWTDTWPWDPPGDAPACVDRRPDDDAAAPPG